MPDVLQFFVIAFSRTEANEIRTEAAISASSEQHAIWLASHFTGEKEGAIALLRSGGAQKDATVRVLSQFGGALPLNSDALERLFRPFTLVSASDSGARNSVRRLLGEPESDEDILPAGMPLNRINVKPR